MVAEGEDGELKRAGIFTRFFVHLIDFFIWFSLLSYFYVPVGHERRGNFILLILGVSISFEIIFKTTPGKFLLKLQTIFEKESLIRQVMRPILKYLLGIFSLVILPFNKKRRLLHEMLTRSMVKKLPCKKRFLRGIGAFILGLYLFATFGIGNIAWEVMKRKSKFDQLFDIPQKFSVPQKKHTTTGIPVWQDAIRFYLPEKIHNHSMESHPLWHSYGIKEMDSKIYRGISILSYKNFHLYHLCKDDITGLYDKCLPCDLNPEQFQKEILYTTPKERWLVFDPISLVKLIVKLTHKAIFITASDNSYFTREIHKNEFTIYWVFKSYKSLQMESKIPFIYADELSIASSGYYTSLFIAWRGLQRDEEVIYRILDTLERVPPSKKLLEMESNLARRQRSIPAAMNAFRISDNSYESAELLYTLLLEKGTDLEKRDFSRRIVRNEDKDRRYKKLIFMTNKWKGILQFNSSRK